MAAENIPQQLTDILTALQKIGPSSDAASLDALSAAVKGVVEAQTQQAQQIAAIAAVLGIGAAPAPANNPPTPTPTPAPPAQPQGDGQPIAIPVGL